MSWSLRLATPDDIEPLKALIPLSAHALQARYYSREQIDAALGPVFGVDEQLIEDGTYYVAVADGRIAGCGGWSRRKALFGAQSVDTTETFLNPQCDAARVRAFFVHADYARQGIGRGILLACESAINNAGFTRIELVATLAGVPLYSRYGYLAGEPYDIPFKRRIDIALPAHV